MNLTVEGDNQLEAKHDELMLQVIKSGNIDALERFIALREREEARQAAKEFDAHFSEMQSEFPAVGRIKQGYGYQYAPVEELQRVYGPIIARHGFSYSWTETALEAGKRCTMRISGHGSSRENSFDIPKLDTNKQMNPVQAAGAMSTYGRRYTFIAGFGVQISDEDNDGEPEIDPGDYAHDIQQLKNAESLTALGTIWAPIYKAHQSNKKALAILTAVKDEQKAALNGK
jgi:hypothetical protein